MMLNLSMSLMEDSVIMDKVSLLKNLINLLPSASFLYCLAQLDVVKHYY